MDLPDGTVAIPAEDADWLLERLRTQHKFIERVRIAANWR